MGEALFVLGIIFIGLFIFVLLNAEIFGGPGVLKPDYKRLPRGQHNSSIPPPVEADPYLVKENKLLKNKLKTILQALKDLEEEE